MDSEKIISSLQGGAKILTPLQLNEMRFSDKRTVLTEAVLKRARRRQSARAADK